MLANYHFTGWRQMLSLAALQLPLVDIQSTLLAL
jgi:hypothetical protein